MNRVNVVRTVQQYAANNLLSKQEYTDLAALLNHLRYSETHTHTKESYLKELIKQHYPEITIFYY